MLKLLVILFITMLKLLLILFIIKLYAQNNAFKYDVILTKEQQKSMKMEITTEILAMKRQKAIGQKLNCNFIRTDPGKGNFDILKYK